MSKKYNREFPHVSTSISDQKVICKKSVHLMAPQNIVESKSHPTKKGVAILVGKINIQKGEQKMQNMRAQYLLWMSEIGKASFFLFSKCSVGCWRRQKSFQHLPTTVTPQWNQHDKTVSRIIMDYLGYAGSCHGESKIIYV